MATIHVSRSGATLGIFEEEKIREGLRTGEFIGTDLGWMEGMASWRPLSELDDFRAVAPARMEPVAPTASLPVTPSVAYAAPAAPTEPLAIWSLVLSIVGFFCCAFLFGIPGVICGHLALSKIKRNPQLRGGGLAMAGLIVGYLGIAFHLIYILCFGGMAVLQGLTGGH